MDSHTPDLDAFSVDYTDGELQLAHQCSGATGPWYVIAFYDDSPTLARLTTDAIAHERVCHGTRTGSAGVHNEVNGPVTALVVQAGNVAGGIHLPRRQQEGNRE
jgi:hypothetical protein